MKTTWLPCADNSDYSIGNLPYGVFVLQDCHHCATRVGDTLVSLTVLEAAGLFANVPNLCANTFASDTLNKFLEHPSDVWHAVRQRLVDLLSDDGGGTAADDDLQHNEALQHAACFAATTPLCQMVLPIQVGDYTDFYSSREHATNVGTMFRGPDNALQPNWLHLPVGYHGRSSTIMCSPHQVRRPCGQLQRDGNDATQGSTYGPCKLLDFELEMAAVLGGPPNMLGTALSLEQARARIFGIMLMNDWSARDIQKWEYVPLGPFTSKNFCTTVSPWIVPLAALAPYTCPTSAGQQSTPVPLPYLQDDQYGSYDIDLTVAIQSANARDATVVCQSNFRNLYWTVAQQVCHHAVTGCIMRAGDLLGSGTISGATPDSFGSMLELSWKGTKTVPVGDEARKFLQDGDTVTMRGVCSQAGQYRVGFGDCTATILPAQEYTAVKGATVASSAFPLAEDRYHGFKLYGYWRSSSTWRVRIALVAKGIAYKTIPINLMKNEHKHNEYLRKNPLGQVPMLEYVDAVKGTTVRLTQSLAIVEFLDEIFPNRQSLLPKDSVERALVRQIAEVINASTQPLQNIFWLNRFEKQSNGAVDAQAEAKKANEDGLAALEALVQERRQNAATAGPYCIGSFAPTMADALLVPQMFNARRFGVDVDGICPTLVAIDKQCSAHAWFQASHPLQQVDAVTE